jgi:hypothetical protein
MKILLLINYYSILFFLFKVSNDFNNNINLFKSKDNLKLNSKFSNHLNNNFINKIHTQSNNLDN